jgi:nitrate reductase NapE component
LTTLSGRLLVEISLDQFVSPGKEHVMWRAPERRVRDRASATRRSFLVLLLVLAIGLFPPLSVNAGSWVVASAYRVDKVT